MRLCRTHCMIKLLNQILDPASCGRDELLGQLNAELVSGDYDLAERELIAHSLIDLLQHEPDPAICEGAYNLLENLSYDQVCQDRIVDAAVANLAALPSACLVHALPIIAYSRHPDKLEILAPFLAGDDRIVREVMSKILSHGNLDNLLK